MTQLLSRFNKVLYIHDIPTPDYANVNKDNNLSYRDIYIFNGEYKDIKLDVTNTYSPSEKDKLYFIKGCNVPRYKVREWGKKHKISITNNIEKSNANFLPRKAIYSLVDKTCMTQITKVDLLKFIKNNYDLSDPTANQFYNLVNNYQKNYIYLNYVFGYYRPWFSNEHRYGNRRQQNPGRTIKDLGGTFETKYFYNSSDKQFKELTTLVSTPDIYHEDDIIELVNEDAAILDEEMFKQLNTMFDSEDRKSWVLALSIITDCNIQKSLHWILLLITAHGYNIKMLKERNHVNFKSLIKYIDKSNWDNLSYDDIMDVLLAKEALTPDILKSTALEVKERMQKNYNTKHFMIKTIEVSDDIKHYFNPQKEANVVPENIETE